MRGRTSYGPIGTRRRETLGNRVWWECPGPANGASRRCAGRVCTMRRRRAKRGFAAADNLRPSPHKRCAVRGIRADARPGDTPKSAKRPSYKGFETRRGVLGKGAHTRVRRVRAGRLAKHAKARDIETCSPRACTICLDSDPPPMHSGLRDASEESSQYSLSSPASVQRSPRCSHWSASKRSCICL
jgi:hypothetical protein